MSSCLPGKTLGAWALCFWILLKEKQQNFLDCISQESSRETEPIGCAYVWKKIYYKKLAYAVMKVGKSAEWAGKLDFTFPLVRFQSAGGFPLAQGYRYFCFIQSFN